jgi:hypothetical protein
MKVTGVAMLVIVSALLSCGPGVPTRDISSGINAKAVTITDGNNTITTNVSDTGLNPPHGQPGHRCDIKVGQPLDSKPAKLVLNPESIAPASDPTKTFTAPFINPDLNTVSNTVAPTQPANGLNPPHGQPGHRHDIQVGQPLNSNPAPSVTPTANATNTTPVATGLNPKHGQPGHRCDIMVGQPLNSKPSLPAVTNNAPSPAITPATNSTYVAPGLNPRHGQPGHRCDILVGQPLNSKPASISDSAGS